MEILNDEQTLAENTEEFVHHYLATRLICKDPEGLEVSMRTARPDIYQTYFEVAIDMFHSGALWADNTAGREGKSIILTK